MFRATQRLWASLLQVPPTQGRSQILEVLSQGPLQLGCSLGPRLCQSDMCAVWPGWWKRRLALWNSCQEFTGCNFRFTHAPSGSIFISCDCPGKLPQTWWLKITEMYALTVLQTSSPTSKCRQDGSPSEHSRGESFPLPSSVGYKCSWLVAASL